MTVVKHLMSRESAAMSPRRISSFWDGTFVVILLKTHRAAYLSLSLFYSAPLASRSCARALAGALPVSKSHFAGIKQQALPRRREKQIETRPKVKKTKRKKKKVEKRTCTQYPFDNTYPETESGRRLDKRPRWRRGGSEPRRRRRGRGRRR